MSSGLLRLRSEACSIQFQHGGWTLCLSGLWRESGISGAGSGDESGFPCCFSVSKIAAREGGGEISFSRAAVGLPARLTCSYCAVGDADFVVYQSFRVQGHCWRSLDIVADVFCSLLFPPYLLYAALTCDAENAGDGRHHTSNDLFVFAFFHISPHYLGLRPEMYAGLSSQPPCQCPEVSI